MLDRLTVYFAQSYVMLHTDSATRRTNVLGGKVYIWGGNDCIEKEACPTVRNKKSHMTHPKASPCQIIVQRPTSALATATVALAFTFLQLKVGFEFFATQGRFDVLCWRA
jgi:hypothetical protein